MNVKSAFLNEILEEEVLYRTTRRTCWPDQKYLVHKLNKMLYGLKQEKRTWCERMHSYLIKIGFVRTSENNNLYLKSEDENNVLIAEIFLDDIIFGGNDLQNIQKKATI